MTSTDLTHRRERLHRASPLAGDGLLYEALAARLTDAIAAGAVKPGERLPSVRALATQYRVSVATAVQALGMLEDRRLVEARPKSGFFVLPRPAVLPEPAISRPAPAARFVTTPNLFLEYIRSFDDRGMVNLGSLLPDPALFPNDRIARMLGSVARRHAALAGGYAAGGGMPQLTRAIAARAHEAGCDLAPEEIIVTNGCVEALNICLRAVAKAGDIIALESPTYFIMLQMIESLGMKALELPTHPRTGLSVDALDLATRKPGAVRAVMLTPSFSSPLGSLMPEENRRALVALCEARGVAVIEDDIYGDVQFAGPRPLPCKAWDRTGNVLLCSSFSKTVAPGLRVGWAAPGRYHEEATALKRIGSIFTPPLPQLAIAEFLAAGGYDQHLRRLRRALAESAGRITAAVSAAFPTGTRMSPPMGGYVLWVELPAGVDAVDLFRQCRRAGIHIAPGPLFTASGRFGNAIRLSLGIPWSARVEQALVEVGKLAARMPAAR